MMLGKRKRGAQALKQRIPDAKPEQPSEEVILDATAFPHLTWSNERIDGFKRAFQNDENVDENKIANDMFKWLIAPLSVESFYEHFFEKRPFVIKRSEMKQSVPTVDFLSTSEPLLTMLEARAGKRIIKPQIRQRVEWPAVKDQPNQSAKNTNQHYYSSWFSRAEMDKIIESDDVPVKYGHDIDVTQYVDGQRSTLNGPVGSEAKSSVLRKQLQRGCSLRFLAPQSLSTPLWRLCNLLDIALDLQVASNSYLTPASTQGFAPHYDDVDVFIMQAEGAKRWRLYAPRSMNELLPSTSSPNLNQSELSVCVLDVLLEAGDCLYAPRGTIHQCVASPSQDSLHVTLSCCLNSSWSDLLTKIDPTIREQATQPDKLSLRHSLPRNWLSFMGSEAAEANERHQTSLRQAFHRQAIRLLGRSKKPVELRALDIAADDFALDLLHSRIAPCYDKKKASAMFVPGKSISVDSNIRLAQPKLVRLNTSTDSIKLHHISGNGRLFRSMPLQSLELDPALAPPIRALLDSYPSYVRVGDLPPPDLPEDVEGDEEADNEDLVNLVRELLDSQLIQVRKVIAI